VVVGVSAWSAWSHRSATGGVARNYEDERTKDQLIESVARQFDAPLKEEEFERVSRKKK